MTPEERTGYSAEVRHSKKITDQQDDSQGPDFVLQEADQTRNLPGGVWASWWSIQTHDIIPLG
jgi:hypothetical protein